MNKLIVRIRNISFIVALLLLVIATQAISQSIFNGWEHLFQTRENYVIYKTSETLTIDGKVNEDSWKQVPWTCDFQDIEGEMKEVPLYRTRVKMLWDDQRLYILAELTEPHIWGYYKQHDKIVYHENDFEVFIDPNGDTHEYFEIEINAQNTVFDLFMTKPYRDGGIPLITWDIKDFQSAVYVNGTVNDFSQTDEKWTVEMAVPFEALRLGVHTQVPKEGTSWKLNFSRVQWQTEIVDGKYKRKRDEKTGRILPEDNWVWSPIGVINMHYPERWGLVKFTELIAGENSVSFHMPEEEKLADYLWLLYYKQNKYKTENKIFASTLKQLDFPQMPAEGIDVSMQATDFQFSARLKAGNWVLSINNEGELHKRKKQ